MQIVQELRYAFSAHGMVFIRTDSGDNSKKVVHCINPPRAVSQVPEEKDKLMSLKFQMFHCQEYEE